MFLVNTARTFTLDVGSASAGTITITITRADGTEIVTDDATTDNSDGTYSYTLAVGLNDQLTTLRLDWTVATGEVFTVYDEVVGSLLFTIEQARAASTTGLQTPLSNVSDYPDSLLAGWREHITTQFENRTDRGWVRRHCRIEASGTGNRALSVWSAQPRTADGSPLVRKGRKRPTKIIAATVDGVAVDPADIQISGGHLLRTDGTWTRGTTTDPFNIAIEYEYGDTVVDPEAHRHGLTMIVTKAQPSDIPNYATAYNNRDGSQTLMTEQGWTYPRDVWEWLKNSNKRVVFA